MDVVGRGGGHDERVDTVRIGARLLHQKLGGFASHVRSAQSLFGEYAALLDSCTGNDPFIIGVDHPRQFLIVEDIVGNITGDTRDDSVDSSHYSTVSLTMATLPL